MDQIKKIHVSASANGRNGAHHRSAPMTASEQLRGKPPTSAASRGNLDEVVATLALAERRRAATDRRCTEPLLRVLGADSDPRVRGDVASHPRTPMDILAKLCDDPDAVVAAKARDEYTTRTAPPAPTASSDAAGEEGGEPHYGIGPKTSDRAAVASVHGVSPDLAAKLAADGEPSVQIALARNDSLPAAVVAGLARHRDPAVRAAYFDRPEVGAGELERAAKDPDPSVRVAVAGHGNVSAGATVRLAEDEDPAVRAAVARNEVVQTPAYVLDNLAGDPDPSVRLAVANHLTPRLSTATIERLAADPDPIVAAAAERARNRFPNP